MGLTKEQFSEQYKDWPVCYHGTSSAAPFAIITKAFRSAHGCWINKDKKQFTLLQV
jgi:hypothetical protein